MKSNLVACPICKKENEFFSEPTGPFCSSRCKMSDLYGWLSEEYKISEELRPDHHAEFEEMTGEDLDRPDR